MSQAQQPQTDSMNDTSFAEFISQEIVAVEGHPDVITNGHIIDLSVPDKDRPRLADPVRFANKDVFEKLLASAQGMNVPLNPSRPRRATFRNGMAIFEFSLANGDKMLHVHVRARFYNYFVKRYPGVEFFGNDGYCPIAAKVGGKLVGFMEPERLEGPAWRK